MRRHESGTRGGLFLIPYMDRYQTSGGGTVLQQLHEHVPYTLFGRIPIEGGRIYVCDLTFVSCHSSPSLPPLCTPPHVSRRKLGHNHRQNRLAQGSTATRARDRTFGKLSFISASALNNNDVKKPREKKQLGNPPA